MPGTADKEVHVPLKASTVGGLIFVNYFNEGQHRVRIGLFKDLNVSLGYTDFTVVRM